MSLGSCRQEQRRRSSGSEDAQLSPFGPPGPPSAFFTWLWASSRDQREIIGELLKLLCSPTSGWHQPGEQRAQGGEPGGHSVGSHLAEVRRPVFPAPRGYGFHRFGRLHVSLSWVLVVIFGHCSLRPRTVTALIILLCF